MPATPVSISAKLPRSVAVFISERVVELREARGWSTYRLAKKAELSEGYLGELEKGKHDPSLTTLLKLTRAFGFCSVEELLAATPLGTSQFLEVSLSQQPNEVGVVGE